MAPRRHFRQARVLVAAGIVFVASTVGLVPETATLKRTEGSTAFVRQVHLAAPNTASTNLGRAKISVLTSGYTGSAAEHLTLAFKRTRRATVIGETAAGLGQFGRAVKLPAGFTAFIPIGRPFEPGIGWEGIGIKPNQEVPARRALEVALLKLGFPREQASMLGKKWMPRGGMDRVIPLRNRARALDDHRSV